MTSLISLPLFLSSPLFLNPPSFLMSPLPPQSNFTHFLVLEHHTLSPSITNLPPLSLSSTSTHPLSIPIYLTIDISLLHHASSSKTIHQTYLSVPYLPLKPFLCYPSLQLKSFLSFPLPPSLPILLPPSIPSFHSLPPSFSPPTSSLHALLCPPKFLPSLPLSI